MKCHYEVLIIAKDADDDQIKKSYRKLALKYHPDKNPEQIEECTREFHLIQQAYDVLIDPQERAWYDKHREAILRGGLGKGGEYEDDSLDVYQYFNTSCFTGYGDDDQGFYAVYREVFHTLVAEDSEFKDAEGESDVEIPPFGTSDSPYDEVVGPFYAYWESYCTAKSYVWEEKYDTREAPNRQIRRLMEQDNKKLRDKAKKERNEEVRALVAFVRKRDKRVQAQKKVLEERALEIAKKAQERKKKEQEKRLKGFENYEETGWSAMTGLEDNLKQLEASCAQQFGEEHKASISGDEDISDEEEEEEEYFDELFCIACGRDFKTDKAFANHERSKKHKEKVALLKAHLEEDDEEMADQSTEKFDDLVDDLSDALDDIDSTDNDAPKMKLSKKQKKKRKQQQKLEKLEVQKLEKLEVESKEESAENVDVEPTADTDCCDKDVAVEDSPLPNGSSQDVETEPSPSADQPPQLEDRLAEPSNTAAGASSSTEKNTTGTSVSNTNSKSKKKKVPTATLR